MYEYTLADFIVIDYLIFIYLFCSIVDDSEMYEQQKPFRLDELVKISAFLNNLVFKMLWNEMVDGKSSGDTEYISFLLKTVNARRIKLTSLK